jgi:glycerone phosphate O-acyltransferase
MRSRTSKFLLPKQGMFATCLECLLKGQVTDIYVVPISVTYERLLEEQLYANELLGIPKPKETLSGLMKARSIMNQSYGTIIINFAQPLSMRDLLYQDKFNLNRLTNVMRPRFIFQVTPDESKAIEACSHDILEHVSNGLVIQPISLICTVLLQKPINQEISATELVASFKLIKKLFTNLAIPMYLPMSFQDTEESNNLEIFRLFYENFKTHLNLFEFSLADLTGSQRKQLRLEALGSSEFLNLNRDMLFIRIKILKSHDKTDLFSNASNYLCICSYRNQLVNFFMSYSIFLLSLMKFSDQHSATNTMDVFNSFVYLVDLYDREFLFNKQNLNKNFDKMLSYSTSLFLIDENLKFLTNNTNSTSLLMFFMLLIKPYLFNYLSIYKLILVNDLKGYSDEKGFLVKLQTLLFDQIQSNPNDVDITYEVLSLNLIQNSLNSLVPLGVLNKSKSNDKAWTCAFSLGQLEMLVNHLAGLCDHLKHLMRKINTNDDVKQIANNSFIPNSVAPVSKL